MTEQIERRARAISEVVSMKVIARILADGAMTTSEAIKVGKVAEVATYIAVVDDLSYHGTGDTSAPGGIAKQIGQ